MIGYKLTDRYMKTRNNFQWELNVVKVPETTKGKGGLCGPGCLHFYPDPLIAVLMNPVHANIKYPRMFECLCEGEMIHEPLKSGCTQMTLLKELSLPEISLEQRVKFAILCALEVNQKENFVLWASKWLDGTDHTVKSANAIAKDANSVIDAAGNDRADNGHAAIHAAIHAAYCAKTSIFATVHSHIGYANFAKSSAAYAAINASVVNQDIDFIKLAKQAM